MITNKDISPRNAKGQPHGYFEIYRPNGELWFKCIYDNGKEIGYEEYYHYFRDKKLTKIYKL